ncbi:serine/threonine phosphatase [Histoplasma capsulatum G186AR]|uniref:Serine/threonine phosphatase n=1 Tax=Ajellomyces capsulatus TaxID=5037 RepID=A0A8H8D3Z0_AJECA|nr:serine/threonine phosphatase [Histoplasma capsulatum]QSS67185.1 serine/threonine phosphatase [Histoplasma capsulatum G186AR]
MVGTPSEALSQRAMPAARLMRVRSKTCGISTWRMLLSDTWFWKSIVGVSARKCVPRASTSHIVPASKQPPHPP